jgi:hypothetical protein
MPVLNPDHLLEQAARLTATPTIGAPRQADLRRAISTAYYGIFHAIVTEAADDFAGRTQRESARYALVYRSIDHKALRTLCHDLCKSTLPEKYSRYLPSGGFGSDLVAVAAAVVDLQEKRHSADYDPHYRVSTSDAVLAVATARSALARFRTANRTRRKALVALLVFSPRI